MRYLVFPQNSTYGTELINDQIGHFTCFSIHTDEMTIDNYDEWKGLMKYFATIGFDPYSMLDGDDCSTCGPRWEEDDVDIVSDIDEIKKKSEAQDSDRYIVVHCLNPEFECDKILTFNKDKHHMMSDTEIDNFRQSCLERILKYD